VRGALGCRRAVGFGRPNLTPAERAAAIAFLDNALADPRAAAGTAPFDGPTLFSQVQPFDSNHTDPAFAAAALAAADDRGRAGARGEGRRAERVAGPASAATAPARMARSRRRARARTCSPISPTPPAARCGCPRRSWSRCCR
jgi:hypothetical protein